MFVFEEINGKKVLKSTMLEGVEHFFTTRELPLFHGDKPELAEECAKNCEIVKNFLNVKYLIKPVQKHTSNIERAQSGMDFESVDALVVDDKNIAIYLNFADCVPVILWDEKLNKGAIAHAGWRGTEMHIVPKTVEFMKELYGSKPSDIVAAIGPAISKERFEVDEPVFLRLMGCVDRDGFWEEAGHDDKYLIDLKLLNKIQLEETGVNRIDLCGYCTYDCNDIFFSYRKESGNTARHSAVLKLKERKCQ